MLSALRDNVGGWVAKIFIGLLALSFAVWGINDIFTGSRGTALVVVGEEEISSYEFENAFISRVNQLSRQLGQQLTLGQARELSIDRQVLAELIRDAALDNQIRQMGLGVSQKAIAQQVADNPVFKNAQGQFDRQRFQALLQQNGMTESSFIEEQTSATLRNQIGATIGQSLNVPPSMVKAIVQHQNETRMAKYIQLLPEDAGTVPEPTEAEQQAFYDENKRSFAAPEFRTLTLLRLEPEDIAETIDVTAEDARQLYDQRISDYITPEKREIQQITFANADEAREAREKILAGTDFLDIATERGLKPIDYNLGELEKSELTDQALADAAFSLPEGEVSEPVTGKLSVVLLRVLAVKPEERKTFEEVEADLRKQLSLERAQEEILNLHDAVEDARAEGATLAEISEKFDLPLIAVDAVDQRGNGPDGKPLTDIPAAQAVVALAFGSDVGVENDPVDTPKEGFVWVDVTEVTPSAIKPIDEVRQEVIDLWKDDKTRELLNNKAEALLSRMKGGATLAGLAEELGKEISETPVMKRRDTDEPFSTAAVSAMFRSAEGSAALAPAEKGNGLILMQVEKVNTAPFDPESAEAKSIETQLTNGIGRDLYEIYLSGLQETVGIQINEQLWEQIQGNETTTR